MLEKGHLAKLLIGSEIKKNKLKINNVCYMDTDIW